MDRILPPTYSELASADPRNLGQYRLLGRLGAGGMGIAYLAESGSDWVVVKVLRPDLADNLDFRTRLDRELDSLRRLKGTNTLSIRAADLTCPTPWFAMEYVEGQNLADRVRTVGPLSGNTLLTFAQNLADQISAIHEAGVTHRDLKPTNIILSPQGPRIIDFGVALVDERTAMTTSGVMVGTLGWAAPEQVAGDAVGPQADIHAWGLCVLFAATGSPPFAGDSAAGLLYRVVHTQPVVPEGLPGNLSSSISAALRKNPSQRPHIGALSVVSAESPTREVPRDSLEATQLEPVSPTLIGTEEATNTRPRFKVALFIAAAVMIAVAGLTVAAGMFASQETDAGEGRTSADALIAETLTPTAQPTPTPTSPPTQTPLSEPAVTVVIPGPTVTTTVEPEQNEPQFSPATLYYVCTALPESLPPLVGPNSDPEATSALQEILTFVYLEDPGPIDGQYGPRTVAAVKRLQARLGVVPDGQVGPITWGALKENLCMID